MSGSFNQSTIPTNSSHPPRKMKTIRLKMLGNTALTVALAMTAAGVFAQDEISERNNPSEKTTQQKNAGEKKETARKTERKVTESKKPEIVKRQPRKVAPRPPIPRGTDLQVRPWLGIAMREIPDSLREYLDLAEGFGVQVEYVDEASPAAKAGLKVHDILTRLDDQLLISPEHVALLVRSKKKGAAIELTFIRKGKEQSAEITLGERELPPFSNTPRKFPPISRPVPHDRGGGFGFYFGEPGKEGHFELRLPGGGEEELQRYLEGFGDFLKEWREKNPNSSLDRLHTPWLQPRKPPEPKEAPDSRKSGAIQPKPIPPLPGKSAGKPPAISVSPGYPLQLFGEAGIVKIDNPRGEITITNKGGSHVITIKNKDGETVYDGPYEDEKSLPKEARNQLKEMKLDDLKLLTPPPEGGPGADPQDKDETKKKGEIL